MSVELESIREFLTSHDPYAQLPSARLDDLIAVMASRYHRRNTVILPAGRTAQVVSIVRSGAVDITDSHGILIERSDEGVTVGVSSARSDQPSRYTVTALEDTLVLEIPAADFRQLLDDSPHVAAFFSDQSAHRLHTAVQEMRAPSTGRDVLRSPLGSLLQRSPVTVEESATITQAAQVMTEQGVSSVLVTRAGEVSGIVTDRDMRRKVVAAGHDRAAPVSQIMTPDLITISPEASAMEAVLMMMRHGIHHLPVARAGEAIGMVTSSDIMRLQQANPVAIVGAIAACTTVDELISVRSRLPALVRDLVAQDATAAEIGRIITAVGDAVTRAVLQIVEDDIGAAPEPYGWVALGSQGRLELGINSDQDNALVLVDRDSPDPERDAYFATLAERATLGLSAVGYPLCPGDVMASNPQWRLERAAWRTVFRNWITAPDSDAVLHADTFFDMRPVTGEDLVSPLLEVVLPESATNPRFLARLAHEAVSWQPPLGFFRGFVLDRAGQGSRGLDLKAGGLVPIVQLARIHALAHGLAETNTAARLRGAAAAGALSESRAHDLTEAHELISTLRLRHQVEQAEQGLDGDNVIHPDALTTLEQRGLRDAFLLIKQAQSELSYTYRLHAVS